MSDIIETLAEKENQYFFRTYNRFSVDIDRGEGCWLITRSGRRILDMFGGLAVNVLGCCHPEIVQAIELQIRKYIHISNFFYQEPQIQLAEQILDLSGFSRIFFTNSGTEAVEGSLKIVRKYFEGTSKIKLISFSGSYHGRSYGALSLTWRKKYRDGFEPFIRGVHRLKFNSVEDLERNIDDSVAALYLESIQGEGGINVVSKEFAGTLSELRKKFGFLLIADEIQSGVGRTGKLHAFENFNLTPDIVVVAKGIGGGLPLGAILGNEKVADVLTPGVHGSTFGGNPVAAACGSVILGKLKNGLMTQVKEIAVYLRGQLENLRVKSSAIKEIRGLGLMVGIELDPDGQQVVERMLERGVLVNCTNQNVIRLLPPYIISRDEIDFFIRNLESVL
jgi:acetylornithine/N-succinyldiaminopimelate aminotransferase